MRGFSDSSPSVHNILSVVRSPGRAAEAIKGSWRDLAPRAATLILVTFLLWKYFDMFFGMSHEALVQISLNNPISPNPAYYPIRDVVRVIGLICLASYVMIHDEITLSTLRNPRSWEDYAATVLGITGLLAIWALAGFMDLSPRTQVPFLIFGGTILVGFLLVRDEMDSLALLIVRVITNPSEAVAAIKESWGGVAASSLAIIAFFAVLVNLSIVSTFVPAIAYDQKLFFSVLMFAVMGNGLLLLSGGRDKPSVASRRTASMTFLLSAPLFLYLTLRIMLLLRTDTTWDVSFDFMDFVAGFNITNWPNQVDIVVDSRWEFHRAGVVNAVRAVLVSIFLCTLIGVVIGVMRLSTHPLSVAFGTAYVEIFRNMPLALLLFSLSTILGNLIPTKAEEVNVADVIWVSNQGIYVPAPDVTRLLVGILILLAFKAFTAYLDRDGVDDSDEGVRKRGAMWAAAIAISAAVVIQAGLDIAILTKRTPSPGSWDYEGGFKITVEFIALVAGLTIYTSAIVAEIVRGSIQSLPRGQVEAAISLSLTPFQRLRLVILPQALRSMIPSMNNQYMNVWKNSSLALIVSYNDLFYVNVVILNKVGKAVPTFALILVTYQIGSLLTSVLMNLYNRRVTRVKI